MATTRPAVSGRKKRLTFPVIAISFVVLTALWFGGPSTVPVSADHIPRAAR
ncbi:MAG: hypothetical protein QF898_16030 [SAR202 cluster bacterium]|nr:hypothetical protein [SAR202 cluster bacterium]MDP6513998.1 hypothetical protein [SAR202 cluster bacterium]